MSTLGVLSTLGGTMSTPGKYHDKCGGRSLGKQFSLYENPSVLNTGVLNDIPPVSLISPVYRTDIM